MLEFPYLQLPGGVTRPIIPVVLEGPSGRRLLDGLLDSGSDRTLFPRREAQAVGLQLPPNPDWHPFLVVARNYYVNLLAARKNLGYTSRLRFEQEYERAPTKQEIVALSQALGTERDIGLIRKGFECSNIEHFFTDEHLVATAVVDGLAHGSEVVVITRDNDVYEHFVKMVELLDIHYQAMLFADQFALRAEEYMSQPQIRDTDELKYFFADDKGMLVKKPVSNLDEFVPSLLPRRYVSRPLYCLLFGDKGDRLRFTSVTYNAESPMLRLLEVKGRTGGLNTDKLQARNCHVTGFPVGVDDPRRWVIVARDNVKQWERLEIPLLDIRHAQGGQRGHWVVTSVE